MPVLVFEPTRPLTLGAIMPPSKDVMVIELPPSEDESENFIHTKLCTKASDRDMLISLQQPGYYVVGGGGERRQQLGSDTIPGNRGDVTFAAYCWEHFVTVYQFPGRNGKKVSGNAQAQQLDKTQADFEDLFGRSNDVLKYFVEACRAAHRLDPIAEAKVEDELFPSSSGVTDEPAE